MSDGKETTWSLSGSERWGLARALFIAGFFGLFNDQPLTESVSRLAGAVRVWFRIAKNRGEHVPEEVYQARLKCCAACPFFAAQLGTCGSPLRKGMVEYGCYCYQRVAARFTAKRCWIDERHDAGDGRVDSFLGHGWNRNGCGDAAAGHAIASSPPGATPTA